MKKIKSTLLLSLASSFLFCCVSQYAHAKKTFSHQSCSSQQIKEIDLALEEAEKRVAVSYHDLNVLKSRIGRSNAIRYKNWFGEYSPARYSHVLSTYRSIKNALKNESLNFTCECTILTARAIYQIYEDNDIIALCPLFWELNTIDGPGQTPDGRGLGLSKAGVIIHELAHYIRFGAARDIISPNVNRATDLAVENPDDAIYNADTYRFFSANTFFYNRQNQTYSKNNPLKMGEDDLDPNDCSVIKSTNKSPIKSPTTTNIPVANALDGPFLLYNLNGLPESSGFLVTQSTDAQNGNELMKSTAIEPYDLGVMSVTVQGPGTFSFDWKFNTPGNNIDLYRFILLAAPYYFDNELERLEINSQFNWETRTYNIPAGEHRLSWSYQRRPSSPSGQPSGEAFIDNIKWNGAIPGAFASSETFNSELDCPFSSQPIRLEPIHDMLLN